MEGLAVPAAGASVCADEILSSPLSSITSATKRNPRRGKVLITACVLPSSSTARLAELMADVIAGSETMRPSQTNSINSSLETTRSLFSIRQAG